MSAAKNAARVARQPLAADDARHGTENGYSNLGCRCARCRRAHTIHYGAYQESRAVALGPCSEKGCTRGQYAKGYCRAHYHRLRVGSPDTAPIHESSVGERDLRCMGCQEWLPDSSFPRASNRAHRRGRHTLCRQCGADARREFRENNKVPCSHGCGTLVLRERRDPTKPPECHPCAMRRVNRARASRADGSLSAPTGAGS